MNVKKTKIKGLKTNFASRSIIVAGMPRAGSTWLYYNFKNHPDINLPRLKETFFFGSNFHRGFDWYESLYEEQNPAKIAFDISPDYFCNPNFFINIRQLQLDHKIVLLLREPNEWLVSLYSQLQSYAPTLPTFAEFLEEIEIKFDGGSYTIKPIEFDYLGVVEQFIDMFRGRLLLINYNELKANPLRVLNEIENFAGVRNFFDEGTAYLKPVNVSVPKFSFLAYVSTLRLVRTTASRLLPKSIRDLITKRLYKIDKESAKDMDLVIALKAQFPPIYSERYFKRDNVIKL